MSIKVKVYFETYFSRLNFRIVLQGAGGSITFGVLSGRMEGNDAENLVFFEESRLKEEEAAYRLPTSSGSSVEFEIPMRSPLAIRNDYVLKAQSWPSGFGDYSLAKKNAVVNNIEGIQRIATSTTSTTTTTTTTTTVSN